MEYRVIEKGTIKYIECIPGSGTIANEKDALDLVGICGEYGTDLLMFYADHLTEDFYKLSTGLAGNILLKFTNYYIKAVAILSPELVHQGKFYDMVIETNRGRDFRVFFDREKAEQWLLEA